MSELAAEDTPAVAAPACEAARGKIILVTEGLGEIHRHRRGRLLTRP